LANGSINHITILLAYYT